MLTFRAGAGLLLGLFLFSPPAMIPSCSGMCCDAMLDEYSILIPFFGPVLVALFRTASGILGGMLRSFIPFVAGVAA